jgi:fructokinase
MRGGVDVACMGEVLWDVFQRGDSDDFKRAIGGAVANVAVGLARLGISVRLVGGVGTDVFGVALRKRLLGEGVETDGLLGLPERTGISFITRNARGEPTFLFYRHATADMAVRAEHITAKMARARWVLVGTSTLPRRELAAATFRFVEEARRQGAGVVLDLNVRPHLWSDATEMREASLELASRAHVIKGSDPDWAALGGERRFAKIAPHALRITTTGPGPARATAARMTVVRTARRVRQVDATGAGDAFIAGVLASLVRAGIQPGGDRPWEPGFLAAALDIGHSLGAKAVSKVGAVTGLVGLGPTRAALARLERPQEDKKHRG